MLLPQKVRLKVQFLFAIKSSQKSTKQNPQKSAQKGATEKSAKKRAKFSSNKSMRTFESTQTSAKKVPLLL